MHRIPEPELMVGAEQVFAYAQANFTDTDQSVVDHLSTLLQSAHVELLSGDLIVDLGCGPGNISERLAERWSSVNIVGVDGAAAMISIANERLQAARSSIHNLRYVIADLNDVSLSDLNLINRASVVVSNSLLHHLHDPQQLWAAVRQLAAPGALMLHRDLRRPSNEQEVDELCDRYVDSAPPVLQRDFRASLIADFTADEIREQLDQAGLGHLTVMEIGDRYLEIYGQW